jgi:ribosomal small subunit protein bTHX
VSDSILEAVALNVSMTAILTFAICLLFGIKLTHNSINCSVPFFYLTKSGYTCGIINKLLMGRGDKKSAKGKRTIGSFGVSRSKKKIKARLKRVSSVKKAVIAETDAKPKVKRVVKKKEVAE